MSSMMPPKSQTYPVRLLLNAGASPDVRNKRGRGVFHLASENGHAQVVALLRSEKCDASVQDCRGYTPLMIASERGNVSILDHLLRCKTGYKSRNVVSDKGSAALHLASRMGHTNAVKTLLKANAKVVGLQNRFGNTPLTIAFAASSGQKEVLRVLLSENIKPDKKSSAEVPYYLLPEKKPWNKQEPWKDGNRIAW
eukprot:g1079.t1